MAHVRALRTVPVGRWFAAAAAFGLILLGGSVVAAWHLDNHALIRVRPHLPPMQYNTALAFLLLGAAVAAALWGRARASAVLGGLVAGFGLLVCVEVATGWDLGIDQLFIRALPDDMAHPGRPAPSTAIAFALCGLALAAQRWRKGQAAAAGAVAVVLPVAAMALFGHLTGLRSTYVWGNFVGMAFTTAVGFGLVCIGLLGMPSPPQGGASSRWVCLPPGLAVATAALILWQALLVDREQQARKAAQRAAHALQAQLVERVEQRARVLERMARRWEQRNGTPRLEWEADATPFVVREKAFQAIAWADAKEILRWVAPVGGTASLRDLDLAPHRDMADSARAGRRAIVSTAIDLVGGGKGLLACAPVFVRGQFDGYLVGVFGIGALLEQLVDETRTEDYQVMLFEAGERIFGVAGAPAASGAIRGEAEVRLRGGPAWRLRVVPTAAGLAREASNLPHLVLALGLALALGVSLSVCNGWQARAAAAALAGANRELGAEMTRRAQTERQLRDSEERFRQAFEFAGTGVALVALDGRWLRANRALCELLGYSETELRGATFQSLMVAGDIEADRDNVRQLLAGECAYYQSELRCRHQQGRTIWVRLTASLLRDSAGAPLEFVAQLEDVTARKELQVQLEQRNAALEVETRRAQDASRLKSEFLATMSHELRTPLNGILGFCSFLAGEKPGPLNPKQKEFVQEVTVSARHLLRLINDLLDLAKIEAGRMDLAPERFSVADAVAEVSGVLDRLVQEKRLRFSASCALADDAVWLDARKFKQVLYNLLSNAIKFTPEGGAIEVTAAPAGGRAFELRVSDTGIGIRPEDVPRLFVEFEQLDAGEARRYEGTGLGLALTKKIVELHGGSVRVESEPGRGATFIVTLPREVEKPRVERTS